MKATPQIAFYFRSPDSKSWKLIGIYPSAESAWQASLDHPGSGDCWFPTIDPGEPVSTEMTPKQFKNYKVRPLSPA